MLPAEITQGDRLQVSFSLPYPDGTASLSFRSGEFSLSIEGTVEGGDCVFSLSEEQTASFPVGSVYWQVRVRGNVFQGRKTIGEGSMQVRPDLLSVEGDYDGRSLAERLLEEVDQALLILPGSGQAYKIQQREFTRANLGELVAWRDRLKWEVSNEKRRMAIANGQPDPRRVFLRAQR